jgi:D-citramalate synthase
VDYQVSIPPGGATDALVETVITWDLNGREFNTRGLDADQTESAIKATERMLNIVEGLLEKDEKVLQTAGQNQLNSNK